MISTAATATEMISADGGWMIAPASVIGTGSATPTFGRLRLEPSLAEPAASSAKKTTRMKRQPGSNGIGGCSRPPDFTASVTTLVNVATPPGASGATRTTPASTATG